MSRARFVSLLVLTLLLGGFTSAVAQEATPAPETTEGSECTADGEGCEVAEEAPAEEQPAPAEEEPAVVEEPVEETVEAETVEEALPEAKVESGSASEVAQRATLALADVTVEVVDFDFNPGSVTVAPGDTVIWTFQGEQPHTVTADDGSFDSGELTSGDFSMRFDEVGTYRYYCALHGGPGGDGMSGIVVVEGNGSSEEPPSAEPNGESDDQGVSGEGSEAAAEGSLPRTGGGPPPAWVFAIALLFSGIVLWRVARLAEIL